MRHHSIKDAHIEEIACIDPLQPRAYIIPFGGTLVFLHDYSHQIQQISLPHKYNQSFLSW